MENVSVISDYDMNKLNNENVTNVSNYVNIQENGMFINNKYI